MPKDTKALPKVTIVFKTDKLLHPDQEVNFGAVAAVQFHAAQMVSVKALNGITRYFPLVHILEVRVDGDVATTT